MPYRIVPLVTGEYYHVFNRGVAKMCIYNNKTYYKRFIKSMLYYQLEGPKPKYSDFMPSLTKLDINKKIADINCYCLMPNHFHFLLKQNMDGGISEFIAKLSNSYTRYYNTRDNRVGPILQGQFKAVLMENNEQLIHVSRYIHLNPLVSDLVDSLDHHEWSSYPEYIGLTNSNICSKDIILDQFKSTEDYKQFVLAQESYGRELKFIKHKLLDI